MPGPNTSKSRWATLRRRPLYLLLALAVAAIALWGLWPRSLAVEAARVQRAPLTVSFREEGRTRLRERYVISAPVDGVVARLALDPGDAVVAGSPLAEIRPARASILDPANRAQTEARLRAVESELAAAWAAQASARAEHDRSAAALKRGIALAAGSLIAQSDLDGLRSQEVAAASALHSAGARVRTFTVLRDGTRAVLDLQGTTGTAGDAPVLVLSAPVDGRVIRRAVESEAPVRTGQTLLEIGDPRALEVAVEVLTADAVQLRPGGQVRLGRWGGPAPLHGRVRTIEPGGFTKVSALGVEEQRTLVVVALDDPPDQRATLGDGFRVEAEFVVWQGPSVLQVPTAALFRDGVHWAVYAIEGSRARLRRIRLGHVGERAAELHEGLPEGAEVVLYPGDSVRDGQRVARAAP